MIREVLLALLPLAAGILAEAVFALAVPNPPVLQIRIAAGLLPALAGGLLSAILLTVVFVRARTSAQIRTALRRERDVQAESHRRFLRRLDHELKNPLTGIRAALSAFDENGPPADSSTALPDIRRQLERLTRLTAGLRKLADLEEIPLEVAETDLGALLEETVDAVRALPVAAGRELLLSIPRAPWPLPTLPADADLISLALYNLMENALKFSRPQDAVEVRAAENDRRILIEVADTGPGIAAEELPRIFEELYRGENARGREGSGLGLALVQRVIERHGGSVTVRSRKEPPHGTIFTVLLPLRAAGMHVSKQ